MKFAGVTIVVPREIMAGEKRVAVVPETVKKFTEAGAKVIVETSAGKDVYMDDEQYRAAGAEIAPGASELYSRAGLILKVKEPQLNKETGVHELELFPEGSVLACFLHPANPLNHDMVKGLAGKNITSFTFDSIPRISRAQQMDVLTSMSTAAGYKAVINAANHLPRFLPMIPTASGIVGPAQVLVVGVGVAGLQSLATAKRLGAKIKALDIRAEANEQAKSLGAEIVPFDLPEGMGIGEGGYACSLSEEWCDREKTALMPYVSSSDLIILSALIPGEEAPILLDQAMVGNMKKGSVIVDISIDQGGNCSLSRHGEEYDYNGIFISGVANIPAYLPVDATKMLAQNVWFYLNHIVTDGKVVSDSADEIIVQSLVTRGGKVVHEGTLKAFGSVRE
ncbi:MAG TPA: hypothetical protein VLH18_01430 [Candidatus Limnocylindrales bacterium]|nr:hypothetical protein [Candidatus Limnocylindrales bacterium]